MTIHNKEEIYKKKPISQFVGITTFQLKFYTLFKINIKDQISSGIFPSILKAAKVMPIHRRLLN